MLGRDPLARPEDLIPRVYAYVAYRIGAGPEAEDVTSETFERALRYRSSYDASRGSPVAWLIGIAARCIADTARGARPELHDVPDAVTGDIAESAADRVTIQAAVADLDERDRELIALRYGADLSARQIAELQGARTNTVEVALHRTLARLRAKLVEEPPNPRPTPSPVRNSAPGR